MAGRVAPEVFFSENFPKDLRADVKRRVRKFAPYSARDLDEVWCHWGSVEGGEASIDVRPQYHIAHLRIDDAWYTFGERERDSIIAHEMAHVITDELARYTSSIIEHYVPEVAREQTSNTVEFFIEKLTDRVKLLLIDLP